MVVRDGGYQLSESILERWLVRRISPRFPASSRADAATRPTPRSARPASAPAHGGARGRASRLLPAPGPRGSGAGPARASSFRSSTPRPPLPPPRSARPSSGATSPHPPRPSPIPARDPPVGEPLRQFEGLRVASHQGEQRRASDVQRSLPAGRVDRFAAILQKRIPPIIVGCERTTVNGGGIMVHAERLGGPVAAAQNCATYCPLSVATRGGGCTAWSSMRRFDWRLSRRV